MPFIGCVRHLIQSAVVRPDRAHPMNGIPRKPSC